MTTPRIYLPQQLSTGDQIELLDDDLRYIRNVLRLKPGEEIALFGYQGIEYRARIDVYAAHSVLAKVISEERIAASGIRITLAQALPKSDKMDLITQKATELGVNRIVPFHSSRSIPILNEAKALDRVKRWRKIALEASRQCGRTDIPEVAEILTFDAMLAAVRLDSVNLIFWEAEDKTGLKQILRGAEYETRQNWFIVVGPEGGLSGEEVHRAKAAGMVPVSLGRQVLKVETASLAILAIIQYEKGLIGTSGE